MSARSSLIALASAFAARQSVAAAAAAAAPASPLRMLAWGGGGSKGQTVAWLPRRWYACAQRDGSSAAAGGAADAPKQREQQQQQSQEQTQQQTQQQQPSGRSFDTTPLMMDARGTAPLKSAEYPSSHDDPFGVQRNWFTSLYKQLNYFAKTGHVPGLKGRQRQVFESVEREFEGLYNKYLKQSTYKDTEHRAMLMLLLSIATYRVLNDEVPDPGLVRDVIRTNQGSMMMAVLLPLHRMRMWVLRYLLAEEPYAQAARFLPALQSDMGTLCEGGVRLGPQLPAPVGDVGATAGTGGGVDEDSAASRGGGADVGAAKGIGAGAATGASAGPALPARPQDMPDEVSLVIDRCRYHEVLTAEDAQFLLSDFCCHHGMTWLNEFKRHGVDVGLERSLVWEDECCQIRVARPRRPQ